MDYKAKKWALKKTASGNKNWYFHTGMEVKCKKQCTNMDLEIVIGNITHLEEITRFQMDMAMESEGTSLDYERVHNGVKAVLEDEAKGRYIIAKVNEEAVGCLMITREWSDWNCGWYWWIQSVCVHPNYRERGIYKTMYGKVLEFAKEENVSQIRLYVDKNNTTAQRVYQRLGMEECHYCMYESKA